MTAGLSSAHAYYHCDGNGNVTALVDTNGVILARYAYDPYGNILSMSGPLAEANLYRFSSKEWHLGSGLIYYLYRYYDPGLQRWTTRDPVADRGGWNLFRCLANNPVNRRDNFGHQYGPPTPPCETYETDEEEEGLGLGETLQWPGREPIEIMPNPNLSVFQALARGLKLAQEWHEMWEQAEGLVEGPGGSLYSLNPPPPLTNQLMSGGPGGPVPVYPVSENAPPTVSMPIASLPACQGSE
ncbi:hypothetical protein SBV1_3250001 [Verrucomicrobia bacterium]|nr:hypothetical protein SBV1_3250001 [Verrucomicrobiota bacterium]